MAKFLKIPVAPSVDSGTTSSGGSGANNLIDTGQSFLTTVSVGDYVVNTTANPDEWYTVDAVVDNENLTLTAITTGAAASIITTQAYTIYDGNSANYTNQLVSAEGVKLVDQTDSLTVDLSYSAGGTGTDVISINHSDNNTGTQTREDIENAILDIHANGSRPDVARKVTLSDDIIVTSIAIG